MFPRNTKTKPMTMKMLISFLFFSAFGPALAATIEKSEAGMAKINFEQAEPTLNAGDEVAVIKGDRQVGKLQILKVQLNKAIAQVLEGQAPIGAKLRVLPKSNLQTKIDSSPGKPIKVCYDRSPITHEKPQLTYEQAEQETEMLNYCKTDADCVAKRAGCGDVPFNKVECKKFNEIFETLDQVDCTGTTSCLGIKCEKKKFVLKNCESGSI